MAQGDLNSFAADYASDIVSTFDIDKPEVLNTLFRSKGDQGVGFFRTIDSLGFKSPVAQDEYSHHEEDWIHETIHANAQTAAGAAGASVSIVLQASTDIRLNKYYPRLWDMVMFPNGVTASVTSISGTVPTITVELTPSQLGDNIPLIAAGQELIIMSAAFSEGSDQPDSAFAGTYKYTNNVQIIKERMTVTGTEMTNRKWFDKDSSGRAINAYYVKGQLDADYRMNLKIDGALLFGRKTTNTNAALVDSATQRVIKSTEGLFPYVESNGNIVNYTPGTYNVSKFNSTAKLLDKEFASRNIACFNGIDLNIDIEDALVDYFATTDINYTKSAYSQMFGGDEGLAASVGFKCLTKAGRTFAFKQLGILSHAKLYGASGYDYSKQGIWCPVGKKKDTKTQNDVPTFGCRYKAMGNYSRMMESWQINGAGNGQKVISKDVNNYDLRTQIGGHFAAGNQMVIIKP